MYLPNDVLQKVDRASMLNSLEVRVPLLDHRIVEFGLNLATSLKNDGANGKLVLRELGRKVLPEGHLKKPKTGFSVPIDRWLREELDDLVQDSLEHSHLAEEGWLKQTSLHQIMDSHRQGRSMASALWFLMMAELWYRDARTYR